MEQQPLPGPTSVGENPEQTILGTQTLESKESHLTSKIFFKHIDLCYFGLRKVAFGKNPVGDLKLGELYKKLDKLYYPFDSKFGSPWAKEKLKKISDIDPLDQPIGRDEALKFYQGAKKVFNRLKILDKLTEEAEKKFNALKQVIELTPEEENENISETEPATSLFPEPIDDLHPAPSEETAIPKKESLKSRVDVFFRENRAIASKALYAMLPLPASIVLTYIMSALHDSCSGAHSMDAVNHFFNAKVCDEGLKTPGAIYGLASLFIVAIFVGIYWHKKNTWIMNSDHDADLSSGNGN